MSVPTAVKVAVAGLFGALALAGTAQADSISFMRGGDVWVASPDGTRQVQLTHDGGYTYQSQADNGDVIALRGRRLRLIGRDGAIKADFSTPVSGERTDTTSSYFMGPFKPEISPTARRSPTSTATSRSPTTPAAFPRARRTARPCASRPASATRTPTG